MSAGFALQKQSQSSDTTVSTHSRPETGSVPGIKVCGEVRIIYLYLYFWTKDL